MYKIMKNMRSQKFQSQNFIWKIIYTYSTPLSAPNLKCQILKKKTTTKFL
eukprot:UN06937